MKYSKFIVCNYRAIVGPLIVDVEKNSLIPIIGVNECGKTTILSAVFTFDHANDNLNEGRHLRDVLNLYSSSPGVPRVSAEIRFEPGELVTEVRRIAEDNLQTSIRKLLRKRAQFPDTLVITRNLQTLKYEIAHPLFVAADLNHELGYQIVRRMPYILFFDDFRDSIDEKIEITTKDLHSHGWLAIIQQLFRETDPAFSVFELAEMEERRRKTVLSKVKRKLNETLTKEWQNFRLDDSDALQISLDFLQDTATVDTPAVPQPGGVAPPKTTVIRNYIKLEVIETDLHGDEHYFFIRDRSKGFFWFFNFVMKLEFNPKVLSDSQYSIYLLDEPGSYLHASAQNKLCNKLRQLSNRNAVIYCTHSHYLLDPEVIPLSTIKVADKGGNGDARLVSIHEHEGSILERRSAFQPVIDALQIKPYLLDLSHQDVVITEGIYDYYAIEMFRGNRALHVLPSVGADSVRFYISLMIAWKMRYVALWDNDDEGRKHHARAVEQFGSEEAKDRFFLLPRTGNSNRILQNLFHGGDITTIRESLALTKGTSFEKVIAGLFYSSERTTILNSVSTETKQNFAELFKLLGY